ncbi:hypothetical protein KJ980_04610 [Patescibacteria group bacterium]|nr:hypothetical protein [Patescibacteria group bacterium]
MKKKLLPILLILLFSIPAILPLFHKGFFVTDDGEWMIIRFSAFHQAFRDGQFPVRFLGRLNQEYGYPAANFMYPGFMYLGEFIHLLRFGFVDTVKIIFGLSLITSAVFAYLWLTKIFNKIPAFFGALFFLYNPYHLFDIYRRGSLGEILAIGIIPMILWSIESKRPVFYAFSIGLLIISHNTLALLFLPLIFIYMYLSNSKYFLFSVLGIGLAAFFWLPAIYDLQFTVFSKVKISNWENYFSDINLLGIANIIVFVITGIILITRKKLYRKATLFFIITYLSIFFSLPFSREFWKFLPVSVIQFPFRVLSISIIGFSFLIAFLLNRFKVKIQLSLGLLLLSILLFYSAQYILKNEYFDKGEGYYSTNMATTTVKDEYMPLWVKQKPLQRYDKKVDLIKGQGSVQDIVYNNKKISFSADIKKDALIQVNTIYWPGWSAFIDGKKVDIRYNNERGLIQFSIPAGSHNIVVNFGETPMRLAGDIVSILSFIILILLALNSKFIIQKHK